VGVAHNVRRVTTLLATKLFEPRVPRALVARPRLVEKLSQALTHRMTLVSAPAGYGKSTLLGEWRTSPEGAATRLAWVSVDEADDDPVRFWLHVAAALQRACPGLGEGLADGLQRPTPLPLRAGLEELVNELADISEPLVLVLDDLHAVTATELFESLAFLVAHLPPHVRLVVSTRSDPPLPLAAMRARGDLAELRLRDLRFRHDEVQAYLAGLGIQLDGDSLGLLEERTEGWAAGLHLAALTLIGVEDGAAFVRSFAGDDRAVVDFLMEEVLARQPEDVHDFLLATSVLERMSGPLCDAVTGGSGGQAMLRVLETANLFIVPLDNTRTWFRYHHLFAELLRRELRIRHDGAAADLHRRAARWLAAEGLVVEAIPHAVTADDWDLAFELASRHGFTLIVEGQAATLDHLSRCLPEGELRARPEAAMGFAWQALMSGDLDGLRGWLETAQAAMGDLAAQPVTTQLDVELLWSFHCTRRGDIAGNLEHIDRIAALLADHPEVVGLDRVARLGGVQLSYARAHFWHADLPAAEQRLADSLAIYRDHQPVPGLVEAMGIRAVLALADGRSDDARRDAQHALEIADRNRIVAAAQAGWAHLAIGSSHLERLELDDAERHLARALAVFRASRDANCTGLAAASWADWLRLSGRAGEAVAFVVEAHRAREGSPAEPPLLAQRLARAHALALSATGDHAGAAAACAEVDGLEDTAAQVALAAGAPDRAIAHAVSAKVAANGPYRRRERIVALAVAAVAHAAVGERGPAAVAMTEAMRTAARLQWLAPLAELGVAGAAVVAELPPDADPAVSAMARRVLDLSAGRVSVDAAQVGLVEKLTERELAVLRRLPSSLSTAEIAGTLYVSLNTVKTQIQSIYRKLGVNSRHEAVETARQLGLL
jgi:LuxR family transcriptional regulator, maltose regulon positive regulatory protein